MNVNKVIKLIEVVKEYDFDIRFPGSLLTGLAAQEFGPGDEKDKRRESHRVGYNPKEKKFYYHSYCESGHNGDYYDTFHRELKPTPKLLAAIVKSLIPKAKEALVKKRRQELERSLERSAEREIHRILN